MKKAMGKTASFLAGFALAAFLAIVLLGNLIWIFGPC